MPKVVEVITFETDYSWNGKDKAGNDKYYYNLNVSGLTKSQRDEVVKLILALDGEGEGK